MKKRRGLYPQVTVDGTGRKVVSGAGGLLLTRTAGAVGLDRALSAGLARWRRPLARHDPSKIVLDLAISLAMGGDCLADVAQLRAHPQVFGPVASDPTVSRCIDTLAADASAALAAIAAARATARAKAWQLAGKHAPDSGSDASTSLVIDVDATLVTAHSEKESAAPTYKRGCGFHPLWAFLDHGTEGTGEPLSVLLRAAPEVFGPVASGPTVSRCIDTLAADAPGALAAIATARAAARAAAWAAAGEHAPDHGTDAVAPLVIDVDATLVTAHSEEAAAPTCARIRLSSAVGLLRPRGRGHRRAAGVPSARGQRRIQHGGRPQDRHRRRAGPAAPRARPRQEGAHPHRRRRWHP